MGTGSSVTESPGLSTTVGATWDSSAAGATWNSCAAGATRGSSVKATPAATSSPTPASSDGAAGCIQM